jgi:hypothetical protein
MKTNNFKLTCLACIVGVIFVFSTSSCALKTQFLTSTVVPAAQGTVQVHINKNKNYVIEINISHLSPSTRLTPPSNAYVVWLIDNEHNSINLGRLNSSSNFMSTNLNVKFDAVSGSKPIKIVITAENNPTTKYPSFSTVVLTTDYLYFKN